MKTCLPIEALAFDGRQPPGQRICRVRRDGDGFEATDYDDRQWQEWQAQAYVRQLNEQRGVTNEVAKCMFVGGVHGWDSLEFATIAGDVFSDDDADDYCYPKHEDAGTLL